jgi:hypothetical protein
VRSPFTSAPSSGPGCLALTSAPVLLGLKHETGASKEFSTASTDMDNAAVDDWTCVSACKHCLERQQLGLPDVEARFGRREAVACRLDDSA